MDTVPSSFGFRSERPLFAGAGVLVAVVVFAGFARTFYLQGVFGSPPLSPVLLVHGLVMTAWVVLFVTQVALVGGGRIGLHRRLGVAGAALAALAVVAGVLAALDAGRRGFTPTPDVTPLAFLAIPLIDMVLFGGLVGTALALRRRPAAHKRLMLLATLGLLTPAVARLPIDGLRAAGLPAFFGAMIVCVLVALTIDTVRNRRLHPAFAWGAAVVVVSVPLRLLFAQTAAWQSFAGWLIR